MYPFNRVDGVVITFATILFLLPKIGSVIECLTLYWRVTGYRLKACTALCPFVCLIWFFTSQSTIFQLHRDWSSWVEPVLSQDYMCLAQGHNTVTPVRLEPTALRSRVKHSTTEPLGSLSLCPWARHFTLSYIVLVWPKKTGNYPHMTEKMLTAA